MSYVIVSNRPCNDLSDVEDKVYTRDLYNRDEYFNIKRGDLMKVSIDPYNSECNKYIELIKNAITNLNIDMYRFDKENLTKSDIYILNWYENLPNNTLIGRFKFFVKKYIKLIILKLKDKKIIWVFHNKVPHDAKSPILSKIIMKYLAKNSYKIMIHSKESKNVLKEFLKEREINEKCFYVPHPNYIDVYKESEIKVEEKKEDRLELLFIGAIKPYKNVDLLIEAFNELGLPDVILKLCGKVSNKEYEKYIDRLINNNSNIITDFRFIEDDELNGLIKKSDILVLPYDIKSSLNSGTIILAFSNKRTVLSPMIGTLKDFENKSLFFGYEYEDEKSHKYELKQNILKIYEIYKFDKNSIRVMGDRCYQEVKENNSIDIVSKSLRNIFK